MRREQGPLGPCRGRRGCAFRLGPFNADAGRGVCLNPGRGRLRIVVRRGDIQGSEGPCSFRLHEREGRRQHLSLVTNDPRFPTLQAVVSVCAVR